MGLDWKLDRSTYAWRATSPEGFHVILSSVHNADGEQGWVMAWSGFVDPVYVGSTIYKTEDDAKRFANGIFAVPKESANG